MAVISSRHAILIRAAVAGESSLNEPFTPFSALAASIASFMPKKIEDARNKGGSPTACNIQN